MNSKLQEWINTHTVGDDMLWKGAFGARAIAEILRGDGDGGAGRC